MSLHALCDATMRTSDNIGSSQLTHFIIGSDAQSPETKTLVGVHPTGASFVVVQYAVHLTHALTGTGVFHFSRMTIRPHRVSR
jgi:hypothetical protein